MFDQIVNVFFTVVLSFVGLCAAWAISLPENENNTKSVGQIVFFWIVLIVCSFIVGPHIAIAISASWGIPLNLKNDLHGWEIVRMFFVTTGFGVLMNFGILSCLKLLLPIIEKAFKTRMRIFTSNEMDNSSSFVIKIYKSEK